VSRYPLRCPSPPAALLAHRSFSTTLSQRKEKDSDKPVDPVEEDVEKPKEDIEKPDEELDVSGLTSKQAQSIKALQAEIAALRADAGAKAKADAEGLEAKVNSHPSRTGSGRGSAAAGAGDGSGGDGGGKKRKGSASVKSSIPEVYPQIMAIPLLKRPLFPGFYKAITIRDKEVGEAIIDMIKRGQPYIGAFVCKDDSVDKDVIDNMDEVYDMGTFCQVTSAFPLATGVGETGYAMTCVLYPHRRIKMTGLTPPPTDEQDAETTESVAASTLEDATVNESSNNQDKGDVVASFHESSRKTTSRHCSRAARSALPTS